MLVLVSVMCETVQPMYMADIIDNGVMQRDLSVITAVGGKMILISIVGLIFSIANVYVSSHASIGFGTDLRTGLFGKIQQLSFFDIDRFSTASLITRLTSDISRIQQVIMMSMRLMLRSPLMLVMAVFSLYASISNWRVSCWLPSLYWVSAYSLFSGKVSPSS